MNLDIDTITKTVWMLDFELSSEELKNLAKRFKDYTFKYKEQEYQFHHENYEDDETTIVFAENTLLDYNNNISCACEDKSNCEKLIKCNNKYLN